MPPGNPGQRIEIASGLWAALGAEDKVILSGSFSFRRRERDCALVIALIIGHRPDSSQVLKGFFNKLELK